MPLVASTPAATVPSVKASRPSAKKFQPVSVSSLPYITDKAIFKIPGMSFVYRNDLTEEET